MSFKSIVPFNKGGNYLLDLHNEVDKVFNTFLKDFSEKPFGKLSEELFSPIVDVSETDKELTVTAELPGVKEEDVSVSLNDNILTIKGEKKMEKEEKGKTFQRIERSYGQFSRSFTLPFKADASKVDATFEKGLLNIIIAKPKDAVSKANNIKIKKKN